MAMMQLGSFLNGLTFEIFLYEESLNVDTNTASINIKFISDCELNSLISYIHQ